MQDTQEMLVRSLGWEDSLEDDLCMLGKNYSYSCSPLISLWGLYSKDTHTCVWCACWVTSDSCHPMDCSPPGSLPMGISRREYWSGLPCPPQGIFPTQGLNLCLLCCRCIVYHWATGEGTHINTFMCIVYFLMKSHWMLKVVIFIKQNWKKAASAVAAEWLGRLGYTDIHTACSRLKVCELLSVTGKLYAIRKIA